MPTKPDKNAPVARWMRVDEQLRVELPQVMSIIEANSDFVELRLKARDDGTTLGILKVFGPDGGPMVCFGVGYGAVLALMALEATIAGGHWKVDRPWQPRKKGEGT